MSAPSFFIRSLLRVAQAQGREVLEAIVTSQFQQVAAAGGKQLTGASANGKSFSYTIPQGLSIMELMAAAEEALTIFDSYETADLATFLAERPVNRTVAGHRGRCGFGSGYMGY